MRDWHYYERLIAGIVAAQPRQCYTNAQAASELLAAWNLPARSALGFAVLPDLGLYLEHAWVDLHGHPFEVTPSWWGSPVVYFPAFYYPPAAPIPAYEPGLWASPARLQAAELGANITPNWVLTNRKMGL